MAWDVIEAKKSGTGKDGIKDEIEQWETANNPSSIDYVETTVCGPNRVAIIIIYTA